jgi:hypothetical protein
MVRSMMSQTDLLLSFWGYALETAVFTLNRVPTKTIERTPRYGLGSVPDCLSSKFEDVRLMSDKLTPKSDICFFVGYPREIKGHYFYNKAEGKVFVARNGVFMEKEFISKGVSGSKVQLEEI